MKFKLATLEVLFISLALSGCGGSDNKTASNEDANDTVREVLAEVTALEGTPFSVELPNADSAVHSVGGVYITSENDSATLGGIAPSVDEDTSFDINVGDESVIKLFVKNKELPVISESEHTYAFSSANIAKYNGYISNGNNIPLVDIEGQLVHYPVTVSKYAHDLYANYLLTNDAAVYGKFIINVNWLRDNCIYTEYGFCSWRTEPSYSGYNTGPDWASAMAQGQAISALISASSLTQDSSYMKVAQDAIAAFYYPGELKGVSSKWGDNIWYEEYTSETPARVLNGFLFALAGLYDAAMIAEDESAKLLWAQGLDVLAKKIDLYDADFTSLYDNDVIKRFANAKTATLDGYHELHVLQLSWLYQVTQNELFLEYFQKFLADDIGTFDLVKLNGVETKKIVNIQASHSVAPETNGPEFLNDRNWTYGNYWSTHRHGTFLDIQLNALDNSPGIQCIMMAARDEKYFPATFDLYTSTADGEFQLAVSKEVVKEIEPIDHKWEYLNKQSIARTYCFNEEVHSASDTIRLKLELGDVGLIALREIDVHYRRLIMEYRLLEIYENWVN